MTKSKCCSGAGCLRTLWIACFLAAVCSLGTGCAAADSDSMNDSAKKVGNNFGELLKGMGQEVKKITDSDDAATKKDNKKEKKRPDNEAETGKEKPN